MTGCREMIIDPVAREMLEAELSPERLLCTTRRGGNEVYTFTAAECPWLMREVGRLREEAFRAAGGGTGRSVDIDADDRAVGGYRQLIVWDPAAREIVGGYRYIICRGERPRHLSTEHYFRFSERFRRNFLPRTIELGRSFVQVSYQVRNNPKSICALDNLWDGLGAVVRRNPQVRYLFGKVTVYASCKRAARDMLFYFLRRFFPLMHLCVDDIDLFRHVYAVGNRLIRNKPDIRRIAQVDAVCQLPLDITVGTSQSFQRILQLFLRAEYADICLTGLQIGSHLHSDHCRHGGDSRIFDLS